MVIHGLLKYKLAILKISNPDSLRIHHITPKNDFEIETLDISSIKQTTELVVPTYIYINIFNL